jgi:uncharacterized protein (DUF58 family)
MTRARSISSAALAAVLFVTAPFAAATVAAPQSIPEISLENGSFQPAELVVTANNPFQVRVTNRSSAAIEFESFELHRERVVQPGETITVYMPPLRAGTYRFFDDFNHGTPQGSIVAK